MSELGTFIRINYDLISIVIGLVGIVVAVFGVIYGRRGYQVAEKIFNEGIRMIVSNDLGKNRAKEKGSSEPGKLQIFKLVAACRHPGQHEKELL